MGVGLKDEAYGVVVHANMEFVSIWVLPDDFAREEENDVGQNSWFLANDFSRGLTVHSASSLTE